MNRYEEKQEAKRERLLVRADAKRAEGRSALSRERIILDAIPFGQPILVGHHSERRHRRDLARAAALLDRGFGALSYASELERRAAAVGLAGISSDDPDAITKLLAERAACEAARAAELAANTKLRSKARKLAKFRGVDPHHLSVGDHLRLIAECEFPPAIAKGLESMARAFSWLPAFGNATQTKIRRIDERIALLRRNATSERAPITGDGFQIEWNAPENRVQIAFDSKPDDARRTKLKGAGFRWSPRAGVWQRHLSEGAWHAAISVTGARRAAVAAAPAGCACTTGGMCDVSHDPATCPCALCGGAA